MTPSAGVQVCVLQSQRSEPQGEPIALPDLLVRSYVYSACEFWRDIILGDVSVFKVQVHNVLVAMEIPVQEEPHGVRQRRGACDLSGRVDSQLRDGQGSLRNCKGEIGRLLTASPEVSIYGDITISKS